MSKKTVSHGKEEREAHGPDRQGQGDLRREEQVSAQKTKNTAKRTLLDLRCPSCNRPLKGAGEVVHRTRIPKIDKCPRCKTAVRLAAEPCDLGGRYWETA